MHRSALRRCRCSPKNITPLLVLSVDIAAEQDTSPRQVSVKIKNALMRVTTHRNYKK